MAKLKRMANIRNWDFLDDFYGYKVMGFNVKLEGFERGFCRCGNTHTDFTDKCDVCGNFSFIKKINEEETYNNSPRISFDKRDVIDEKYVCSTGNDKNGFFFSIVYRSYQFSEKSGIVDLIETSYEVFRLYKNIIVGNDEAIKGESLGHSFVDLENLNKALRSKEREYILEYFENNCEDLINSQPNILKYFPSYTDLLQRKKFYSYLYSYWNPDDVYSRPVTSLEKATICIMADIYFEKMFKDANALQYPNILKALLADMLLDNFYYLSDSYFYKREKAFPVNSLDELIPDAKGHFEIVEYIAKEEISLSVVLCDMYSHLSIYKRIHMNLSDFLENMQSHETGLEDVIWHYVQNGMIPYFEGNYIFYNARGMSEIYKPLFKIYLKENVYYKKQNLYNDFFDQVNLMADYDIPLTEENFKIKTYNGLINHKILADTYKLPTEKVDYFLDMFEYNPLEAMDLIANRRKITQKELDVFLDKIFKKI